MTKTPPPTAAELSAFVERSNMDHIERRIRHYALMGYTSIDLSQPQHAYSLTENHAAELRQRGFIVRGKGIVSWELT